MQRRKVIRAVALSAMMGVMLAANPMTGYAQEDPSANATTVYDEDITMAVGDQRYIEDSRTYRITTNGTEITGGIHVKEGCSPTIYLDRVNINNSQTANSGIYISSGADVTLYLVGENVLQGGIWHQNSYGGGGLSGGAAGIYVPQGATLSIYSGGERASLTAKGGTGKECMLGAGGGAGIGTNGNYSRGTDITNPSTSGTVLIYGGSITAVGGITGYQGGNGAGIGGGGGNGDHVGNGSNNGTLVVYGGTVTATATANAHAVGGGSGYCNAANYRGSAGMTTVLGGGHSLLKG